ncbi:MAG: ATPase, T2SS/T4P/T4SS family [Planctomycetota bacterium]
MTTATDQLVLRPKGWRGRAHPLDGREITIGRHPTNAIRLVDDRTSRHHCLLKPDDSGRYVVQDLQSRNGTRVNEVKVDQTYLDAGDVLRVGDHEFTIELRPAEDATDEDAADIGDKGRKKGRKAAESSAAGSSWAREIRRVVEAIPPAGPLEERITILNASGERTEALRGESPGPVAIRLMLASADRSRATDIHLEPRGETYNARLRVDGQMVPLAELPSAAGTLACNLIKTACEMEVAGRQAIHDGTLSAIFPAKNERAGGERRVEYRVSFTPAVGGQKLVMRVLDGRGVPQSVDDLGLAPYMLPRVKKLLLKDQGMLLVCGPTGSGKTTTLHNCVREINREAKNVVTIEDPVEYKLDGVTQIPVDDRQGLGFSGLLRSVLRQDPDVILVGEIRDEETARTAMQAAMTGHLVFSTVHAKDTVSAVFRVLDLGLEGSLVANALNVILAQRLVRVLCPTCRREVPLSPGEAAKLGPELAKHMGRSNKVHVPVGCKSCLRTGFIGRRAIFELLEFNDELRDIVLREPSIQSMKKIIEQDLFTTLRTFGLRLAAQGVTSLDEVNQVAGDTG